MTEKWEVVEYRSGRSKWYEIWKGTYTVQTLLGFRVTWMTKFWAQRAADRRNRAEAAAAAETHRVVS